MCIPLPISSAPLGTPSKPLPGGRPSPLAWTGEKLKRLLQFLAKHPKAKSSPDCPLQHGWTSDESLSWAPPPPGTSPPLPPPCTPAACCPILWRPHAAVGTPVPTGGEGLGAIPGDTFTPGTGTLNRFPRAQHAGDTPAGTIRVRARLPAFLARFCLPPSVFLPLLACASARASACLSARLLVPLSVWLSACACVRLTVNARVAFRVPVRPSVSSVRAGDLVRLPAYVCVLLLRPPACVRPSLHT